MSVTIMAPTPALPPVRSRPLWGKMFGSFKLANKKRNEDEYMDVDELSEKMNVSMSTAVDTAARPTLQQRHSSLAVKQESSRRVSKPASLKSTKTTASTWSRRSSSRKNSWFFSSSNPDDEDVPDVPDLDLMPRSPTYIPRSAASSFLKTTTPIRTEFKTEEVKKEVVQSTNSPDLREKAAHLKPIIITPVELRRNPQDALERHGMHSMAGICDIEEDTSEEDMPLTPMSCISPRTVVFDHKRADTFLSVNASRPSRPFTARIDSAKTSPELSATKHSNTVAVAELEG